MIDINKKEKYSYEVGERIIDNLNAKYTRDITIIERKYIKNKGAHYRYRCNKCGFECGKHYKNGEYKEELWVYEKTLKGCSCCSNKIVVENINSIVANKDTQWMVKYFQGGYDEAKKYTRCSNKKVYPICPHCGQVKSKKVMISSICNNRSIACPCSDKKSYISKYMYSILKQLKVEFVTEYRFDWCKFYNPFKQKDSFGIYDFVINNMNLIIETDGGWHKKDNTKSGQTKEESIFLDNKKDELCIKNGYQIIRISDEGNIRENILKSELNILFDLTKINWLECNEYSLSNLAKIACNYWRENPKLTTSELGVIMGYDYATIRK